MVTQKDKFYLDSDEVFEKSIQELLNDFNASGLKELMDCIKLIKLERIHENFYNAYIKGEGVWIEGEELRTINKFDEDIFQLAYENLKRDYAFFSFNDDLINFKSFSEIYSFIVIFYYLQLGKKLEHQDALNIYKSKIDQRIIIKLDNFNQIGEIPKITSSFFKKLKKTRWENKKSETLFKKLKEVMYYLSEKYIPLTSTFRVREEFFILSLAACSAVNNNREKITMDDVVMAYKTYFKLLRTDLPSLIEEQGVEE